MLAPKANGAALRKHDDSLANTLRGANSLESQLQKDQRKVEGASSKKASQANAKVQETERSLLRRCRFGRRKLLSPSKLIRVLTLSVSNCSRRTVPSSKLHRATQHSVSCRAPKRPCRSVFLLTHRPTCKTSFSRTVLWEQAPPRLLATAGPRPRVLLLRQHQAVSTGRPPSPAAASAAALAPTALYEVLLDVLAMPAAWVNSALPLPPSTQPTVHG